MTISDEEKKLLEGIASSRGITLQKLLENLGHTRSPESDSVVEFKGKVDPEISAVVESNIPPEEAISPPPAAVEDEVEEETEPNVAAENETELAPATLKQFCVQCGWDQTRPTIPEPGRHDKLAFLHALLGQKVFSKSYPIYGGNMEITLRSLTIQEIDVLYQETFRAQKAGIVITASDYYEFLNRLRLYLQINRLVSSQTALQIKLPDGLTKETHPDAASHWDDFLKENGLYQPPNAEQPDSPSLIMQIQAYILKNVLKTEHLQRSVAHTCNRFNQLTVKLEASVDNPDFWKETEPQR